MDDNEKPAAEWPHIEGHAGDADIVSTVPSTGIGVAFAERPEVVKGAALMAEPLRG